MTKWNVEGRKCIRENAGENRTDKAKTKKARRGVVWFGVVRCGGLWAASLAMGVGSTDGDGDGDGGV